MEPTNPPSPCYVVPGPTGHGIPVIDFLALNEKNVTMTMVFEFFKQKNPVAWRRIQTFVIDKHFVEWRVVKKYFQHAFVLFCQFHTFAYWKKILRSKFGLQPCERDIVQRCFANMMYRFLLRRPTCGVFRRQLEGLSQHVG
ncbi:hypothetical protein PHMEG_00025151 [Phytophthora megakarya]|uniref:ZSWIM1/3 RNaseH-like domain-containing protein n=1 Tax=Phytophthora megakarya TaxID=4795 RepID=A0A225VCS1_9STRA|nr:hypothetical protein PHMEG_00025151 [Phytophthora megakarya]